MNSTHLSTNRLIGHKIRVRGLVQGVGFRPCVWRLAHQLGVVGFVINDAEGVLIEAWATQSVLESFVDSIRNNGLPLARVDRIETHSIDGVCQSSGFEICQSAGGNASTAVAAEAASCAECIVDSTGRFSRRYRYPFTNCTHCGPRLTIIRSIPYDRAHTSMSVFPLCAECKAEYEDPCDRRYHAQPTACSVCGPMVKLRRSDGGDFCRESLAALDDLDACATLLLRGQIVAVKGLGGFQLLCDASNHDAVSRLRQGKRRYEKPFALMARDIEVIRRYCKINHVEATALRSSAAPIVLLQALPEHDLSPAVARRISTLGFMLPNTPLHHLLMERLDHPVIFTSGNLSEEPQCIDNDQAVERLGKIADYILDHNREIVNRVDDSVVRVAASKARVIRRARGYAPAPFPLPCGFKNGEAILAMGAELKNTFCLLNGESAVLSQHIGDLADALTYADYEKNLSLYQNLFQHKPSHVVVDRHPEYLSTKLGKRLADRHELELHEVQHHHAHIAACLVENNYPLTGKKVLGVALDGLGFGDDGELWGGEFLLADYLGYERLGTFKPVELIGGSQAMYEPWRNTYAHLLAEMGWSSYKTSFAELDLTAFFESKPLATISSMLQSQTNVPQASSCGRLFDAVAAAMGICREKVFYEGQAAIELEAIACQRELELDDKLSYPFTIALLGGKGLPYIEPLQMWQAVLADMMLRTPAAVMSARFHKGLARAIVQMVDRLCTGNGVKLHDTVVLTGGVFQNKILLEQVVARLENREYEVLTHSDVPANDGGIALGQALVCAARLNVR